MMKGNRSDQGEEVEDGDSSQQKKIENDAKQIPSVF